jgi:putative FmdB family regulatory protein
LRQNNRFSAPYRFKAEPVKIGVPQDHLIIRLETGMKREDHDIDQGLTLLVSQTILSLESYLIRGEHTMPIFEFRCVECGILFEKLFLNPTEKADMACPDCNSRIFERVVSRANYAMGAAPGAKQPKITTRSCSPSNECMTLDIPGPTK